MTTLSQHGETMGEKAANMLINRLEDKKSDRKTETVVVKTDLVERKSTRKGLTTSL
jgi:LacI family transcriptional regulator